MKDVHAALLLPQNVICGPHIEEQHALVAGNVRDGKNLLGGNVGEHITLAFGCHFIENGRDVSVQFHFHDIKPKRLSKKFSRRVIVANGHLRASDAFIARRNVEH